MVSEVLGDNVLSVLSLGARFLIAYIAIMWLALVFWTVRDIRRRTSDPLMQAAATLLTLAFFVPGYWLYLVVRPRETLRERAEDSYRRAILAEYASATDCPACHQKVRSDFVCCPYCEYTLGQRCEACAQALIASWKSCPHCGTTVKRVPTDAEQLVGQSTSPVAPKRVPA